MAALELQPGATFDPDEFAEFLAQQPDLGSKWAPRYVRVTTLPVGATGKVDKRPLRRERWYTDDPVYWRPERAGSYRALTPDDVARIEAAFAEHERTVERP